MLEQKPRRLSGHTNYAIMRYGVSAEEILPSAAIIFDSLRVGLPSETIPGTNSASAVFVNEMDILCLQFTFRHGQPRSVRFETVEFPAAPPDFFVPSLMLARRYIDRRERLPIKFWSLFAYPARCPN